jgi:hypothetical protein
MQIAVRVKSFILNSYSRAVYQTVCSVHAAEAFFEKHVRTLAFIPNSQVLFEIAKIKNDFSLSVVKCEF